MDYMKRLYAKKSGLNYYTDSALNYMIESQLYIDLCVTISNRKKEIIVTNETQKMVNQLFRIYSINYLIWLYFSYIWNASPKIRMK
jgi:hypothetical protein